MAGKGEEWRQGGALSQGHGLPWGTPLTVSHPGDFIAAAEPADWDRDASSHQDTVWPPKRMRSSGQVAWGLGRGAVGQRKGCQLSPASSAPAPQPWTLAPFCHGPAALTKWLCSPRGCLPCGGETPPPPQTAPSSSFAGPVMPAIIPASVGGILAPPSPTSCCCRACLAPERPHPGRVVHPWPGRIPPPHP